MIAQTVAAHYPGRVRTLTSIMSTTGAAPSRPAGVVDLAADVDVAATADAGRGDGSRREHVLPHRLTRFPFDENAVREVAGIAWDRDPTPGGHRPAAGGHLRVGDRTAELGHIDAPTLVIHGDRDRMVHPTGGAATARAIPRARLETIDGLGHDLPIGSWIRIIDLITDHASWAPVTHTELEEHA